ncbi:MAG: PDZ domain-containing protein [Chloroflexota bacterium]
MQRRFFLVAGALPLIAAFGAIIVGLGLVVFGDNGSSRSDAATASPTEASANSATGLAWLGVSGGSNATNTGVAITQVADGSPAKGAGIAVGDLITKIDGASVTTIDALSSEVQKHSPGDEVTLSVVKNGVVNPSDDVTDVKVTLGTRPPAPDGAPSAPGDTTGGGFLGVSGEDTPDGNGVKVTDVGAGTPAEDAGIVPGDIILSVDGETMDSFHALASLIKTHSPGDNVTLSIDHNGGTKDVDVTLGSRPATSTLPDIGGLLPGLGGLGGILKDFSLDKLIGGQLQYIDASGDVVTLSADAGKVTSISSDKITIQPPSGDAKTFDIPSDAHFSDGLAVDDQAIVLQKDGTVVVVMNTDISKLLPSVPDFHIDPNGLFPDTIVPHCLIDDNGVNCDFQVTPPTDVNPPIGSNSNES